LALGASYHWRDKSYLKCDKPLKIKRFWLFRSGLGVPTPGRHFG